MIGISGSNLTEGSEQTSLFEAADEKKNEKLDAAIDAVRAKFGQKAIKFASSDAYHTKYAENDEAGD